MGIKCHDREVGHIHIGIAISVIHDWVLDGIRLVALVMIVKFNGANVYSIRIIYLNIASIDKMRSQLRKCRCQFFFRRMTFEIR